MDLKRTLISTAILTACIVTPAVAADIDVNMQYSMESKGLTTPDVKDQFPLESVERIINANGDFATSTLSEFDWRISLHEKMASKYSVLSNTDLSATVNYSWQSELGLFAPWRTIGVQTGLQYHKVSEHTASYSKVYLNSQRYITDSLLVSTQIDYQYSWREQNSLNTGIAGVSVFADQALTSSLSLYGQAKIRHGEQLIHYSDQSDLYNVGVQAERSTIKSLSELFSENWYSEAVEATNTSLLIGLNLAGNDVIALDVTYEISSLKNNTLNSTQEKTQVSLFLAY